MDFLSLTNFESLSNQMGPWKATKKAPQLLSTFDFVINIGTKKLVYSPTIANGNLRAGVCSSYRILCIGFKDNKNQNKI